MTEDKVLKIEKVNDNQIKCILTREDLEERKISFSELTFGSSQANELLRDMMQQASVEVGFEADDKPLMVEIVPMQTGLIVFVITKMSGADKAEDALISGENTDIQEDIIDDEAEDDEDEDNNGSGRTMEIKITQQSGAPIPLEPMMRSLHDLFREMMGSGSSQSRNESKEPVNYSEEGSRLFLFDDMDALLGAAKEMRNTDCGASSLYKDRSGGDYYLIINPEGMDKMAFSNVCLKLMDFGRQIKLNPVYASYIKEHYRPLIERTALEDLTKML